MHGSLSRRTGNLSIAQIRAAVCGAPAPDGDAERAALGALRAAGFDEVEDYVAWAAVERERGRPDFEHHRANARAARAAGLVWVPFLWAHAAPRWARELPSWVPARCREHGEPGPLPSLFAEETWDLVERFWRLAGDALADLATHVAIGFPADYGELGYGAGMADWLLVPWGEVAHHHAGVWCGDALASGALPADEDGMWRGYRERVTEWTERLLALAAACFPAARLEIKIGHGSEAAVHGVDWHAVVRAAARANAVVRSTHSGLLPVCTRRLASLCRSHGARFATEAPRGIGTAELRRRVHADLAEGTTSWFAFPEQDARLDAELARAMPCAGRGPARRCVAALVPRRVLDGVPGAGAAEALHLAHDALAAIVDFAVLDEAQIEAGELDRSGDDLAALVVLDPTPGFYPRSALAPWIERGGVLILAHGGATPRYSGAPLTGEAFAVEPGLDAHRPWIGSGWGGRADAAPAWGLEVPIAARWTDGCARVLVPRPLGAGELSCEVYAERPTRVVLRADGRQVLAAPLSGPGRLAGPLPERPTGEAPRRAETEPLLAVDIEATPLSSDAASASPPRLLVRDVLVGAPGAEILAAPANPRVACAADGPGRTRLGRGLVLCGDGTPLSALAWLRTWLRGELGVKPPPIDRDPDERTWVASWGDARLAVATNAARPAK